MPLKLSELERGLPEGLTIEEARAWLREANATVEAAVGLIATPEQMRSMTPEEWHALKEDPFRVSDLVREAHRAFRERYGAER
ncbi:MAG TPA: hypothetical protein VFC93_07305 [Chloroflexota bacterium]|jgi:hypothetical protein|nr:hypothetical protein [Chloroflexota bacterium]